MIDRVATSMNSMAISMLPLLEMAERADIVLVPSEDCKSGNHQKKKFNALMNALGLGSNLTVDPMTVADGENLQFSFVWGGKSEVESYVPLKDFLRGKGLIAQVVGSGSGLPDGLLYDVDVFTLKPNISVSSEALRRERQEPRLIFRLKVGLI